MESKDYDNVIVDDRTIYMFGDIEVVMVNQVIRHMVGMTQESYRDITLVINSDGGNVSAGVQLIDMMKAIEPDICTVAMGSCSSAATDIIACGAEGKRYASPNTWFMIHETSMSEIGGRTTDVAIDNDYLKELNRQLAKILAAATGQPLKKILEDTKRDLYMTAQQAKKYGIIDIVGIPEHMTETLG